MRDAIPCSDQSEAAQEGPQAGDAVHVCRVRQVVQVRGLADEAYETPQAEGGAPGGDGAGGGDSSDQFVGIGKGEVHADCHNLYYRKVITGDDLP